MSLPGQPGGASGNMTNPCDRARAEPARRPKHPGRAARAAWVHSFVLITCAAACGCAGNAVQASEAVWRDGRVQSVVALQQLDAGVPVCGLRSGNATWQPGTRVAIVRSRVGKASYDEAFVVAPGLDVRAGSDVRFDRADCTLRPPRTPASS